MTLYTIGCPKCNILEKKLDQKNIQYEKVTDISKMQELGIDALPVLEINNELYSFTDAVNYINNL